MDGDLAPGAAAPPPARGPRAPDLTPKHVARTLREVPRPEDRAAAEGFTALDEDGIARVTREILDQRPPGPLWIFAYGSLMWKPVYEPARRIIARAHGWHREFSIEIDAFRGTPEAPGLMMALMPGGSCRGVVEELAEPAVEADIAALVRREMPYAEFRDMARWIRLRGDDGPIRALTFWAAPHGDRVRPGLPPPVAARQIARACGYAGSSAEYLHRTVDALHRAGIHDTRLWHLQRLVAQEIDRLYRQPDTGPAGKA